MELREGRKWREGSSWAEVKKRTKKKGTELSEAGEVGGGAEGRLGAPNGLRGTF